MPATALVRGGDVTGFRKLNCKEAGRIISQGLDKDLTPLERVALRMHLAVCTPCNVLKMQFIFMRRALAAYAGRGSDREDSRKS
jgi:hypothetical protein